MQRSHAGRGRLIAGALALVVGLAAPGAARAAAPVAGTPGLDDPYYPLAGNGGYDVKHYSLDLDYRRAGNQLDGRAVIVARATQSLRSFNLDLRGFALSRLNVNGVPAAHTRAGQELTVTPRSPLRAGLPFVVRVDYAGQPEEVIDPDGSSEGWVPTEDGAFVVNEPQGSPGWYPANDNPRDKATYDFAITVPEGITAIATAACSSSAPGTARRPGAGSRTRRWRPYLATATNGVFELRISHAGRDPALPRGRSGRGPERRVRTARRRGGGDRLLLRSSTARTRSRPGAASWTTRRRSATPWSRRRSRSTTRRPIASTVVHEISHQWFGNAVTLTVWPDIWLNEGFATFSEWIYDERHGGPTAQEAVRRVLRATGDRAVLGAAAGQRGRRASSCSRARRTIAAR